MVNAKATLCQCNSSANLGPLPSDGVRHSMEAAVEVLLRGLGEDVNREGLRDTPRVSARAELGAVSRNPSLQAHLDTSHVMHPAAACGQGLAGHC